MAIITKAVSFPTVSGSAVVMSNTVVSVEGTENDFTVKVPVNGLGLQELNGTNVASSGSVTLTGGIGDVTDVTVDGVSIISATVVGGNPLDLDQQAYDLAVEINTTSSVPDYTASAAGAVVTIFADASLGSAPNTFVVVATTDAALTDTPAAFAGGTDGLTAFLTDVETVFALPLLIGGSVNLNAYYVRSVVENGDTGSFVYYSDEFGMFVNQYESSSNVAAVKVLIDAL